MNALQQKYRKGFGDSGVMTTLVMVRKLRNSFHIFSYKHNSNSDESVSVVGPRSKLPSYAIDLFFFFLIVFLKLGDTKIVKYMSENGVWNNAGKIYP